MDINLDKFNYSSSPNILNEMYKETPINEILTMEDFLKLPVNESYKKNKESKNEALDSNIKFNKTDK